MNVLPGVNDADHYGGAAIAPQGGAP